MTAISKFAHWWNQLPVEMRLQMNKADCEFSWISSSNCHAALERQSKHASETMREACLNVAVNLGSIGDHDRWFDCADAIAAEIRDLNNKQSK